MLVGTANIWITEREDRLQQKLSDVRALGLDAVRVADRVPALQGRHLQHGPRVIEACARAGVRVILGFHEYTLRLLEQATDEDLRRAGALWGEIASRYPEAVVGFSTQNEHDIPVGRIRARRGDADARRVSARHAAIIREFSRGVADVWDDAVLVPGGLAHPTDAAAAFVLEDLVPDLHSGLLHGVGLHFYADRGRFTFSRGEAPPTAHLEGPPIREQIDRLLERTGLPHTTRIYVQECGVRRTTFRSDEEAAAATAALLAALRADPRVAWALPYSPWPGNPGVTADFAIRPGTPVGDAVAAFARRV